MQVYLCDMARNTPHNTSQDHPCTILTGWCPTHPLTHHDARLEPDQVTCTTLHDTKLAVTGCEDTVLQGSRLYSEYCSDARALFGTGRRLLRSAAHDDDDHSDDDGPEVQSKPLVSVRTTDQQAPTPPSVWRFLSKPTYRVANPYELPRGVDTGHHDAYTVPEPPLLWEAEE